MKTFTGSYQTGVVKGFLIIVRTFLTLYQGKQAKPEKYEYVVPYKGKTLKGGDLEKKLTFWAKYGTIENDTADAIASVILVFTVLTHQVVKNNKWCDLSDQYIVLLGAGSAMGPYSILMSLGANVIAIDLDRYHFPCRQTDFPDLKFGRDLFPLLRTQLELSLSLLRYKIYCRAHFPHRNQKPQSEIKSADELYENAGSNLITQAPEILNWLKNVYPGFHIYIYLCLISQTRRLQLETTFI